MAEDKWLIAANGEWPTAPKLLGFAEGATHVIAADGGAGGLAIRGIRADVIIGDLDSLKPETVDFHCDSIILQVKSQEETDLAKALNYCLEKGASEVIVIGVSGGRSDHFLGIFATLFAAPKELTISLILHDAIAYLAPSNSAVPTLKQNSQSTGEGSFLASNSPMRPPFHIGEHVSIFALGGEIIELNIHGFKYESVKGTLQFSSRGIHNSCTAKNAEISYNEDSSPGKLLIIRSH